MSIKIGDRVVVLNATGWSTVKQGDILEVTATKGALVHMPKGEISLSTLGLYPYDFELIEEPKDDKLLNVSILCTSADELARAQQFLFDKGHKWVGGHERVMDYWHFARNDQIYLVTGTSDGDISWDTEPEPRTKVYKVGTLLVEAPQPEKTVTLRGHTFTVSELRKALEEAGE